MPMLRLLCGLAGAAIVCAVAVANSRGHADLITAATVGGVIAGSLALGAMLSARRYGLAIATGLALAALEMYQLVGAGDRIIAQRSTIAAPEKAALHRRDEAQQAVVAAEQRLARVPTDSPRLAAALTAKTAADQVVLDRAADRSCAANCRALLEQQVAAAAREVAEARREIDGQRLAAEQALEKARLALGDVPSVPATATLASVLGLPGYAVDMVMAMLGSLGFNLLAACLLVVAGHAPKPERSDIVAQPSSRTVSTTDPVASYLMTRYAPGAGRVTIAEVWSDYQRWCNATGRLAVEPVAFCERVANLTEQHEASGVRYDQRSGTLVGLVARPMLTAA